MHTPPRHPVPTVRRLRVDLDTPLPRHWCDGDALQSAFFNALSMSFPFGEQFFIDAVRAGVAALPADQAKALQAEVQGFLGQEATHRHLHTRFNRHLQAQGLHNAWEGRAQTRVRQLQGLDSRHALAITAANEHFTALFADWVLSHPTLFTHTEPRLKALWQWHSAEELEHKSTAFDVYRALGGDERWRRRWMRRVTVFFLSDVARQTLLNLHRDGQLWRWRTLRSGWRLLLGQHGLLRLGWRPWCAYFRADFHPDHQTTPRADAWLRDHGDWFETVGQSATGTP
ncbi:metal-dependent hydrolase [Hydrogenophaga defluvii]|uniref:Metal-dependent hydrolase n=1 Tax=Hydrogenophaga defluvii TaxID=249410 RepID=A0ABW2SH82_9BURK